MVVPTDAGGGRPLPAAPDLAMVLDALPHAAAIIDTDLCFVQVNAAQAKLFQRDAASLIGHTLAASDGAMADALLPYLRNTLNDGRARLDQTISIGQASTSDGESLRFSIHPLHDPQGGSTGLMLFMHPQCMPGNAVALRSVLDSLFAFVGLLGADGEILEANRAPLDAAGIGFEDVSGKKIWDAYWFCHDAGLQEQLRDSVAAAARGEIRRYDMVVRMKDDTRMTIDFMLAPLRDGSGNVTHLVHSAIDISERQSGRQQLEDALAEKTTLLNEVHHRVKNNLQVVCSLLNLKARSAGPEARVALDDSQNRVKAMSLLHQLLYERSDFARVDLALYLRRLASLFRENLGEARSRVTLNFELPDADMTIDMQRAVPCGLLVNELVGNAIKHAFPDGRHGTISLRAEVAGDESARIVIADDGIGIPPDVALGEVSSLGFQLVPLLVDQLGGEIRLVREHGSQFEINFKTGMEK